MEGRQEYLSNLRSYTEGIDNEVSMILQNLQWDRNHLLQNPVMATCRYDSNHKIPPDKTDEHESVCYIRHNGYTDDDQLLPDPLDTTSSTLVKLSKEDIAQIIGNTSRSDPMFKRGVGCRGAEPMSLPRLQASYSADERRAIHDAVVSAVPSCHDLADLALLSDGEKTSKVILTRFEILAELRNMRRRRVKYRVAAKTRNYSDVLRDVIKTQMEVYNVGENEPEDNDSHRDAMNTQTDKHAGYKKERSIKIMPRPLVDIKIKTEKEDFSERYRDYRRENSDREHRYDKRSRERHVRDHHERSRARRYSTDQERRHRGRDHSRRRYDDEYEERSRHRRYERSSERRYNDNADRDLVYRVKREPGVDEDPSNYSRQKRRSRDERYESDSDREYYSEQRSGGRRHRDDDLENRKKRKHLRDHSKYNKHKERSREDRRREYNTDRARPTEGFVKQEREDSATRENYRTYDYFKECPGGEEHYNQRETSRGGRHEQHRSRQRSEERRYIKQEREDSATREDYRTYDYSKESRRREEYYNQRETSRDGRHEKHRSRLRSEEIRHMKQERENSATREDYRMYERDNRGRQENYKHRETLRGGRRELQDGNYTRNERSRDRIYIKQEREDSTTREEYRTNDRSSDNRRREQNYNYTGTSRDDRHYRDGGRSRERIYIEQEREDSSTSEDNRTYERSRDRRKRKQRYSSYSSSGSSSYTSTQSESEENYNRNSHNTHVTQYDPNKIVKVEK